MAKQDLAKFEAVDESSNDDWGASASEISDTERQRMEMAGMLAGSFAHDVNNMLTVIQHRTDALAKELGTSVRDHRDLSLMFSATERAAAAAQRMMRFIRQSPDQAETVDTSSFLTDVAVMMRQLVSDRMLLSVELDAPLPVMRFNCGHIEQLLLSAALSARDMAPEGAMLILDAKAPAERTVTVSLRIVDPMGRESFEENAFDDPTEARMIHDPVPTMQLVFSSLSNPHAVDAPVLLVTSPHLIEGQLLRALAHTGHTVVTLGSRRAQGDLSSLRHLVDLVIAAPDPELFDKLLGNVSKSAPPPVLDVAGPRRDSGVVPRTEIREDDLLARVDSALGKR